MRLNAQRKCLGCFLDSVPSFPVVAVFTLSTLLIQYAGDSCILYEKEKHASVLLDVGLTRNDRNVTCECPSVQFALNGKCHRHRKSRIAFSSFSMSLFVFCLLHESYLGLNRSVNIHRPLLLPEMPLIFISCSRSIACFVRKLLSKVADKKILSKIEQSIDNHKQKKGGGAVQKSIKPDLIVYQILALYVCGYIFCSFFSLQFFHSKIFSFTSDFFVHL